jgi:RNA polymerase sigma-70 factor (ECF subfamily)
LTALSPKKSVEPLAKATVISGARRHGPPRDQSTVLEFLSKGHPSAFWHVWEAHRDYLYTICLRQMGGVREDAEDALSRAMLRAYDKLPRHAADIGNLKGWLTRLVHNLCIDIHRERRRAIAGWVEIDEMSAADEIRMSRRCRSPEDLFMVREVYSHVLDTVAALPERLREPFTLRFFDEMAYPDIAKRLTLTQENVRKRIQIARSIIEERLNQ